MRSRYYDLINSHKLEEKLSYIPDIPYSKKYEIIEELLKRYDTSTINRALYNYDQRYIKTHRVISYLTKNVLIGLCNEQEKKRTNI